MKIGGIIIGIAGVVLFFWHLYLGGMDADFNFGYASHHVRSVDGVILVVVGVVFYIWGRHRYKRQMLTARRPNAPNG